ncbi:MAG: ATP-binding protein [Mycobacteriales bacterium]
MRRPNVGMHISAAELDLRAARRPPLQARRWCMTVLESWNIPTTTCDDAILATSELVSNAILHAPPVQHMRLVLTQSHVVLEVVDSSLEQPHAKPPDFAAESGRGLFLIERIAERWGSDAVLDRFTQRPTGKVVWCLLRLSDLG